jgi:hypothetical protein
VLWLFYPFNGPARAKVGPLTVRLGRIGEHVTLRVSNFSGALVRAYFSQHSAGEWVDASRLEYDDENGRPVSYASLHGHALYPRARTVLQGDERLGVGIRNDCARGGAMEAAGRCEVMSADYLGSEVSSEPAWMGFDRGWGPREEYDLGKEINRVARLLPRSVRERLEKLVNKLFIGEGPWAQDARQLEERREGGLRLSPMRVPKSLMGLREPKLRCLKKCNLQRTPDAHRCRRLLISSLHCLTTLPHLVSAADAVPTPAPPPTAPLLALVASVVLTSMEEEEEDSPRQSWTRRVRRSGGRPLADGGGGGRPRQPRQQQPRVCTWSSRACIAPGTLTRCGLRTSSLSLSSATSRTSTTEFVGASFSNRSSSRISMTSIR